MRALEPRWAFKDDRARPIDRLINYFGDPHPGSGGPRPVMGLRRLWPQPTCRAPRPWYHTTAATR